MPSFRLPKKKARKCTLPAAIKVEQTQKIEDMWGLISENFHWSSCMISIYRWFSCGSHVLCSTCQPKDVEEKEAKIKNPSGYLKAYPKSGTLGDAHPSGVHTIHPQSQIAEVGNCTAAAAHVVGDDPRHWWDLVVVGSVLSTYFQCTRRSGHRTFPRTPLSENRNFRCSRLLSSAPAGDPLLEWRKPRSTTWIDSKLRCLDDCGISEAYYHIIHTHLSTKELRKVKTGILNLLKNSIWIQEMYHCLPPNLWGPVGFPTLGHARPRCSERVLV
jgi:hypothetical protein